MLWIIFTGILSLIYLFSGILSMPFIIFAIWFVYWIPKVLTIEILEKFYPQIMTRNSHLKLNTCEKMKNLVSLTFDDLPYGDHEKIISILNKHQMKATFFIISGQVNEKNFDVFVQAVKDGHQLGNHGKTNSCHYLLNADSLKKEITECDNLIRKIYEKAETPLPTVMVYRPGCGFFGKQMLNIVNNLKYKLAPVLFIQMIQ